MNLSSYACVCVCVCVCVYVCLFDVPKQPTRSPVWARAGKRDESQRERDFPTNDE